MMNEIYIHDVIGSRTLRFHSQWHARCVHIKQPTLQMRRKKAAPNDKKGKRSTNCLESSLVCVLELKMPTHKNSKREHFRMEFEMCASLLLLLFVYGPSISDSK